MPRKVLLKPGVVISTPNKNDADASEKQSEEEEEEDAVKCSSPASTVGEPADNLSTACSFDEAGEENSEDENDDESAETVDDEQMEDEAEDETENEAANTEGISSSAVEKKKEPRNTWEKKIEGGKDSNGNRKRKRTQDFSKNPESSKKESKEPEAKKSNANDDIKKIEDEVMVQTAAASFGESFIPWHHLQHAMKSPYAPILASMGRLMLTRPRSLNPKTMQIIPPEFAMNPSRYSNNNMASPPRETTEQSRPSRKSKSTNVKKKNDEKKSPSTPKQSKEKKKKSPRTRATKDTANLTTEPPKNPNESTHWNGFTTNRPMHPYPMPMYPPYPVPHPMMMYRYPGPMRPVPMRPIPLSAGLICTPVIPNDSFAPYEIAYSRIMAEKRREAAEKAKEREEKELEEGKKETKQPTPKKVTPKKVILKEAPPQEAITKEVTREDTTSKEDAPTKALPEVTTPEVAMAGNNTQSHEETSQKKILMC